MEPLSFSPHILDELYNECHFSASRSSGPGGQNVNKVNSKIELRFSLTGSSVISTEQKQLLRNTLKNHLTRSEEVIVTAQDERSQIMNKSEAFRKFILILENGLKQYKTRKASKMSLTTKYKRMEKKRQHSGKKLLRKPPIL